jgi:hypothetical protein
MNTRLGSESLLRTRLYTSLVDAYKDVFTMPETPLASMVMPVPIMMMMPVLVIPVVLPMMVVIPFIRFNILRDTND